MMTSLNEPASIAHYNITVSIKKFFDEAVPSRERSRVVRSLLLRYVSQQYAWPIVLKEFGLTNRSQVNDLPIHDKGLVFFKLEALTRKRSLELVSAK